MSDGRDTAVFLAFAKEYYAQRPMQKQKPCLPTREDYVAIFGGRDSLSKSISDGAPAGDITTRLLRKPRLAPYATILRDPDYSPSLEQKTNNNQARGKRKRIAPTPVGPKHASLKKSGS